MSGENTDKMPETLVWFTNSSGDFQIGFAFENVYILLTSACKNDLLCEFSISHFI